MIPLFVCLLMCLGLSAHVHALDWPGVWTELESASGDAPRASIQYASGHSAVDWQTKGGTLFVDIDLPQRLPGALLYLRYTRDAKPESICRIDVKIGPVTAKDASAARDLGHFDLETLGPPSKWRWLKIPIGDLEAGKHRLFLSAPADAPAGALDLLGVLPGDDKGLWDPPNDVLIGNFRDKPRLLPALELLEVRDATFGDLLPEATVLGANAAPTSLSLHVKNNQVTTPLDVDLVGQLTDARGQTLPLPPRKIPLPASATQDIKYDLKLPAPGGFNLNVDLRYPGGTANFTRFLRTVPFEPLWFTLRDRQTRIAAAGDVVTIDLDLPAALPKALLYLNYARANVEDDGKSLSIFLAPPTATTSTADGARKLGTMLLLPTNRNANPVERWAIASAGDLAAGKHRLLLQWAPESAPPATDKRPPATQLIRLGLIPDVDRGLWTPPTLSATKTTREIVPAHLETSVVRIDRIASPQAGQLFLGSQHLGEHAQPIPFALALTSNIQTGHVDCVIQGELQTDRGPAAKLPELHCKLEPGAQLTLDYPVHVADYGWYQLQIQAVAEGVTTTSHSSFGILHDPVAGPRPDSIFGLAVGETPADMAVAQLLGVKWRRGIPHTNPADVLKKTGEMLVRKPEDQLEWWNADDIAKVRAIIADWKSHGVLCLGYVNYNLPWNCLGGAAGGWHKNRPADMNIHVDMVYHLIKPLADEVKYWEIWNEPWIGGWTWRTGTAQDYRDMTRQLWDKIKPEMPDVQLIGGGSTPYQRDIVFAQNSPNAGYVDGLSTHPYGKPDTNHPAFAALESAMLKKFAHAGGTGGIWVTELGTAAYMFAPLPHPDADFMVARTVAPLYLLGKLGAGQTPIHLFFFTSQYGSGQFSGGEHNLWDASAGSPAPLPALVAFSTMAHFVEDAALVSDLYSSSKAAWALHFVKPDGTSIVTFFPEQGRAGEMDQSHASESERQRGEMILPAEDFQVYDYLGRPIGTRDGDMLRVPVQTWEARYFVSKRPVEKVRQAFLAAHFKGLPALMVNPRSFDAPLAGKPKLRFHVENLLPQTVDAKLDVTPPAEIRLTSSSIVLHDLKPGEQRTVEFALAGATPNDINRYLIKYHSEAAGVTQDEQQTVQVACATFGTPKIDGDLADWDNTLGVTMLSRGGKDFRQIAMDPSQAAALLNAKQAQDTVLYRLWTKWDAQNLYVAARIPGVTAPNFAQPYQGVISSNANIPYVHDCLQLAFDCLANNPDDLLRGNPLYEKSLAADVDYEFLATRLSNGVPELHRLKAPGTNYQSYYPTNAPTTPPLGALKTGPGPGAEGQVAIRYDAARGELIYELAIPWSSLKELGEHVAALQPGQSHLTHFAFSVNDSARGRTAWTQEAGDLQAGSYGFSPNWGGGNRPLGGRIITDWTFRR